MQRGRGARIKRDHLRAVRRDFDVLLKRYVVEASLQHACLRLVGYVFYLCLNRDVRGVHLRQRKIGRDQRIFDDHWPARREVHLLPYPRISIANSRDPVPSNRRKKRWPVDRGNASVLPDAIANRVFMRITGVRLRIDQHREDRLLARLYVLRDIKGPTAEGALHRANLSSVDPHLRRKIDSVKVEPYMLAGISFRNAEDRSVPVRRARQAVGNLVRTIVLAIEWLRIDAVIDETRQYRARHGSGVPVLRLVVRQRN